jgi:hypothetical protein
MRRRKRRLRRSYAYEAGRVDVPIAGRPLLTFGVDNHDNQAVS